MRSMAGHGDDTRRVFNRKLLETDTFVSQTRICYKSNTSWSTHGSRNQSMRLTGGAGNLGHRFGRKSGFFSMQDCKQHTNHIVIGKQIQKHARIVVCISFFKLFTTFKGNQVGSETSKNVKELKGFIGAVNYYRDM